MRLPSNKKIILVILVGVLIIIFLNLYQSQVRNFFYLISEPIQKKLWSAKIQEENTELQLLTQDLLSRIATLTEVEKENQILRGALEIGLQKEFKLTLGQITGKNIAQDSLIINKGAKDGIKNNLPVVTQQKVLVGKVDEVYENFSRVQLISNKKTSLDGKILGREVQGLVKGAGNFKITFDLVPQYEEIQEGELLTTTALGGIFPAGLLIGSVKSVKKSDIEPFQQIEIQPTFDIKQLNHIFIITDF